MPRDAYPLPPGTGPDHAAPQPDVIYCPLCAAHLRPVPSQKQPEVLKSHSYECEHGHRWEINRFPEARPWNGARPGWDRDTGPE